MAENATNSGGEAREPGHRKGLLDSLTTLATTLVAIAHTRLDLLSTDLEEDREHLLSLLIFTLCALFFFGVGLLLASILLVVIFWDSYRLLVLALLAGCFLLAGAGAWWIAVTKAKNKPRLFAGSMSELLLDRQQLASRR
jgi:uncharacterized membrane protein YqjE